MVAFRGNRKYNSRKDSTINLQIIANLLQLFIQEGLELVE